MFDSSEIKGHMEVLGSDGQLVGTVDHLDETDRIKLVRKDRAAHDPDPHYIPIEWVARVDRHVHLTKPMRDVVGLWATGADTNDLR